MAKNVGLWEYGSWALAEDGCGNEFYETRAEAEAAALELAEAAPGMRWGIYQCVALVEAKVAKPKVRAWNAKAEKRRQ